MRTELKSRVVAAFAAALCFLTVSCGPAAGGASTPERVSSLGKYQGYSAAVFDGWTRTSQYVTVRDGTRIAIDVFRPTKKGLLHAESLPVIWEHRRYQRASVDEHGRISSQLDRGDHPMRTLIPYGYIYAVADVRGSGASFGTRVDATPPVESLDAYDITEWLASRRWCSGRVGMYGISYSGTAQFMAAGTAPPHLRAVFPEMAMFDLYDFCCPNGIHRHTFMKSWAHLVQALDMHRSQKAAPVAADADGALLSEALRQHRGNFDLNRVFDAPYRDTAFADLGPIYQTNSPASGVRNVLASKVAIYQRAGWLDMFPRDMLLWFCNLDHPRKIAIGPWHHYSSDGLDRGIEMLRWFDYWLKDIDNRVMDEPPVAYYVMGAPQEQALRRARQWPPAGVEPANYYFCDGPSGSVASVNDGLLGPSAGKPGADAYVADYTTTSGSKTRWMPGPPAYADMTANDRKALTFTTEPLTEPMEVIGHPVVHLWLQCSAHDVDVFAYLEEVDAQGRSNYVTEGCLRASHRAISEAPYDHPGLPYHRSFEEDAEKLGDGPVELAFDMLPTAKLFPAGHRLRIAITCADKDSYQHLQQDPAPRIAILRDASHPSRVILPLALAP